MSGNSTWIAGTVGLLVGVGLGVLFSGRLDSSPSPSEQVAAWTEAGYSPEEARRLVAIAVTGGPAEAVAPVPAPGPAAAPSPPPIAPAPPAPKPPPQAACAELARDRFESVEAQLEAMAGHDGAWESVAKRTWDRIPREEWEQAVAFAWTTLCE